ncbi:hypothetical protein [Pseudobacteriovorax antillogorgiicola]|uniref:Uncharacterized protein n=1 Tax=Pseudobacteriovorax antillogorgiicola TaxID=1513793 RepID=A0A1Y6C1V4_9BACT|nr:hypothetical protein [Pseudobacteriovorax antillogorgiicola]TCS50751.1 hypothetical protein EDD56_112134 [Pseudobacteriovorax antillogorgiicola]SMF41092.1 hypothetical protein SAMN06296036_112133 [Pseudobacteriovorax antillogorgiicola]
MKLSIDNRKKNLVSDTEYLNCNEEMVINYILKIDGKGHTRVSLERDDKYRMHIMGGPDHFIVIYAQDQQSCWALINKENSDSDEPIELFIRGTYISFSKSIVVGQVNVIDSVIAFLRKDEETLKWKRSLRSG